MVTDIIAFILGIGCIWFLVDQAIKFTNDLKK